MPENEGMGYFVWHDRENGYAGIMCSTSDVPLPVQSFIGPDAEVQAEDFLAWLGCDPRDKSQVPDIQLAQMAWWIEATDDQGDYIGTGEYAEGGANYVDV